MAIQELNHADQAQKSPIDNIQAGDIIYYDKNEDTNIVHGVNYILKVEKGLWWSGTKWCFDVFNPTHKPKKYSFWLYEEDTSFLLMLLNGMIKIYKKKNLNDT